MILDKNQMTEEDIKLNYITPAINRSGWVKRKQSRLKKLRCKGDIEALWHMEKR